jgi:hypothetical protein
VAQKPPKDQKPDAAAAAQAQAQQQEIQNLVRAADAAMGGQAPPPSDFPVQWQNDFLKAQGSRVWVPLTLTIDPAKVPSGALTLYLRVVPRGMTAPPPPAAADPAAAAKDKDKDKKDKKNDKNAAATPAPAAPNYPFEDAAFLDVKPSAPGQPLRIQRGIGVPSGSYDVYVVVHERTTTGDPAQGRGAAPGAAGKLSVLKQPLDVPNFGSEFSTSSVILAERVDELPAPIRPDQQSERPYAFGPKEIVLSPDRKFKKSQELIVLFQIYNPSLSPEKKFNLEATYTFFVQGEGGAEKRFNATEPQSFTTDSMGGGFDPSGNSSIQAGQGVALQSFPEGTYRLEIKVTDKLSNKVLTQNVNFTVTP